MTDLCRRAALRTHRQAASLMEAAMLTALDRRAETLVIHENASFVPVERLKTLPASDIRSRKPTGGSLLHARGISLPGPERMNAWRRR